MKYIVAVDDAYMVMVEAESSGSAEHQILDNYYGISNALAFSMDELGTDTFRGKCDACTMISLGELQKKCDDIKAFRQSKLNDYFEAIEHYAQRENSILKDLEEIKKDLEEVRRLKKDNIESAEEYARTFQLPCTFVPQKVTK